MDTASRADQRVAAEDAVRVLLRYIGEDPTREGLRDTPRRYVQALLDNTQGFQKRPQDVVGNALFNENHQEIVVVNDIKIYSLCEHHLAPFSGKVYIGYLPNERVVGLSKLARLANLFAQRLQVQERLTTQIALSVQDLLNAKGVGVIMECTHMCMEMRGVRTNGTRTVTRSMLGLFCEEEAIRRDFEASVRMIRANSILEGSFTTEATTPTYVSGAPSACSSKEVASNPSEQSSCPPQLPLPRDTSYSSNRHSFASDFQLYLRCAKQEYSRMVSIVEEATYCFGKARKGHNGLSLLEIGPGNGNLLRELVSGGLVFSRYTAFEPDTELCLQLERVLGDLTVGSNARIVRESFTAASRLPDKVPKPDLVLLSHSLYGIEDKYSVVENALSLVAPGGMLLVFHRWTARGTVSKLSNSLFDNGILHHVATYDVVLDVEGLTHDELARMSTYTKKELLPCHQSKMTAQQTLGYIAIEPHACRLGTANEISSAIDAVRQNVAFTARSRTPSAVIQPSTGMFLEKCLGIVSHQGLTVLCSCCISILKLLGSNLVCMPR